MSTDVSETQSAEASPELDAPPAGMATGVKSRHRKPKAAAQPETPKPKAPGKPKGPKPKAPGKPKTESNGAAEPKATKSEPSPLNAAGQIRRTTTGKLASYNPRLAPFQVAAARLKMAADPNRLAILSILGDRDEVTVTELCRYLGDLTQPAVSHHLALLRHSVLIVPRRHGKNNFYRLTDTGRNLVTLLKDSV